MYQILLVGTGGFIGASLRYTVSVLFVKVFGNTFPYGTLFVNILGGLLIGFLMEASISAYPMSGNFRLLLTTGLLGGLTTFSTFSYETISMFHNGSILLAGMNAGLNLFLSLAAVCLGKFIVSIL